MDYLIMYVLVAIFIYILTMQYKFDFTIEYEKKDGSFKWVKNFQEEIGAILWLPILIILLIAFVIGKYSYKSFSEEEL